MKRYRSLSSILFALVTALALLPAQNQARADNDKNDKDDKKGLSVPITGTVAPQPLMTGGGSFEGRFRVTSWQVINNGLVAFGNLTGTLKDAAGGEVGELQNLPTILPFQTPTGAGAAPRVQQATCPILRLDTGAIMLNLLGLQINVSPIHLEINAQAGPGNLLGNLLCAVANLLNRPPQDLLAQLVGLLNQIVAALNRVA